jgi:hypothetical protein
MLAHHHRLSPECKANFLAVPIGDRDYWLFKMKAKGDTVAAFDHESNITVGADNA